MLWCLSMNCPFCSNYNSRVVDSRDVSNGIRRRRKCLNCDSRFTTYERLQSSSLFVIKKDQRREEFDKDKLLIGIRRACEKRPLPTGTLDKLADDVETELYKQGGAEVSSVVIGDIVMERLKGLDYIAYIRFASVYREFTDITTLKQEIDALVSDKNEVICSTSQLPLLSIGELETMTKRSRK